MTTTRWSGAAIALGLAAGCATSGGGAAVSDADYGRLQRSQTGPVDQARQFLDGARDEQARARLGLQQAQHEDMLAKADAEAAKAAKDRADAQDKIAGESRDPAQLQEARTLRDRSGALQRAADAHADWAKKAVSARKSAGEAADKQVALGEARVQLAKLQALRQAGVPAASKYDEAKFQKRVDAAQKDFDGALQKTREQEAAATASERAYQDARTQAQAQAVPLGAPQTPPTGTGTGR